MNEIIYFNEIVVKKINNKNNDFSDLKDIVKNIKNLKLIDNGFLASIKKIFNNNKQVFENINVINEAVLKIEKLLHQKQIAILKDIAIFNELKIKTEDYLKNEEVESLSLNLTKINSILAKDNEISRKIQNIILNKFKDLKQHISNFKIENLIEIDNEIKEFISLIEELF